MRIRYVVEMFDICAWHRCQIPANALNKAGHVATLDDGLKKSDLDDCDVLVVQRLWTKQIGQAIDEANARGILTVFELDDDLWMIHESNPVKAFWSDERLKLLQENIRRCKLVTTTTETLAKRLRLYSDNVVVLPNMVAESEYGFTHEEHKRLVIGWSGSNSHYPDIRLLADVITQLLDRYPNVVCRLAGAQYDWLPEHERLEHIDCVSLGDYPKLLQEVDIAMVPLVDNRFNSSKSDLKVLEYAASNVAVVASEVESYKDTPALLARNSKDWLKKVGRLIEDKAHRDQVRAEQTEWARSRGIDRNIERWIAAYSRSMPDRATSRGTVSIVIPCYNQAQWLPDAIESALAQTHACEVIVVNDGSTDGTSEVARRYPVTLIEQKNRGLSGARNAGVQAASGEFILPLDSDDVISPTYVEKALVRFTRGVKVVNCYQREFGDYDKITPLGVVDSVNDILSGNRVVCCSMYRREDWKRIGGYDERMTSGWEDWEFWIRMLKKGGRVATIPEPLFGYRKHGRSMVDDANDNEDQNLEYIRRKHRDLYRVAV